MILYDCLALIMISLLFTVRYILKITNQQQSHIYSPKQLFMVAVNKMQISIIKVYITFEYFPQTSLHLGLNKSIYVTQKLSHSFTSVVLDLNFKMYWNIWYFQHRQLWPYQGSWDIWQRARTRSKPGIWSQHRKSQVFRRG